MKITDLKEEFIKKANGLAEKYNYVLDAPKIGTQKMELHTPEGKVWIKKRDDIYLFEHICLEVSDNFTSSLKHAFSIVDEDYIIELLSLALEYWDRYVKLKGKNGYILYATGLVQKKLFATFSELARVGLSDIELNHLHHDISFRISAKPNIIGAKINSDYSEIILTFNHAIKTLESIVEKHPLFTINEDRSESIYRMFHSGMLTASYHGDTFSLQFNPGFKKIRFTYVFSGVDKPDITVDVSEEGIVSAFRKIEEENKILTLINPPDANFKKLLRKVFYLEKEELLENLFETLCETLGSWQTVEKECDYMIKNSEKSKIHELSDEVTRKAASIYKLSSETRLFYFVYTCRNTIHENYEIIVSNEENLPLDIKEKLFNFFMDNGESSTIPF